MTSDPPELGKGILGYRKSAVNQILADRDIMLRQAEGRVRAAESKVAELEGELNAVKDRNTRMDEQLDRLRTQLDTLAGRMDGTLPDANEYKDPPQAQEVEPIPTHEEEEPISAPGWQDSPGWEQDSPGWEQDSPVADMADAPPAGESFAFGESEAEFAGLDGTASNEADTIQTSEDDLSHSVSIFGEPEEDTPVSETADAGFETADAGYQTSSDRPPADSAWLLPDPEPQAEPAVDMDLVYGSTDYSFQPEGQDPPGGTQSFSSSYDAGHFGESIDELPPVMTFDATDGRTTSYDADPAPITGEAWDLPDEERESNAAALAEASASAAEAAEAAASSDFVITPDAALEPAPSETAVEPEAARPGPSAEAMDLTNRFVTDEIQGILAAAEDSAARIVERARATTQHQIAQSNRLWREVQAEVSRFATWREQVEPVIRSVQSKVESVRIHIDEVPERIRQALAPMADSISSVDADLAELASASSPPLLLTPRGVDAESNEVEDWISDLAEDRPDEPEASTSEGDASEGDASEGDASGHMAG